ncbi:junctional sarcoplasmic reticulum protein 1 isoform X2 [Microtus pennsylvanicus]|uniref:junctional sarcoplasmic reticulum protein 1 isoform X2 n=1 Tax=Microtus pennsylvanicus TaxID=10058 RepID=UPI003F6D65EC
MTARGLEDLEGGLGSCLPSDDFSLLEEPSSGRRPDGKAQGPRSVPARRKLQAAPPLKPPPPPPPPRDDLPWGDLTLNKCLVLASLVALMGSAVQLCQDAVAGEVAVEVPQQWVPPSPPPKKPEVPAPKPPLLVPPSGPPESPGPQVQKQEKPEAAEAKTQGEPGGSTTEAFGEECAPLGGRGSQERPREKSKEGEKLKKEKLRREKPRKEERQWVTREPRQSLSRRWEAHEGGHRPWTRPSRELEHEKRQAWAPRRRHDRDDRPRQKSRRGKGRD